MSVAKIKLDKDLLQKAKSYSEEKGYSSVEEFIHHIVEKEISHQGDDDVSEEELKKRLQGLGYLS